MPLRACVRQLRRAHGRILLTGRTDNFLQGNPDLDDTIRRLVAFAEVGADVLYAPGLPDLKAIEAVVRAVARCAGSGPLFATVKNAEKAGAGKFAVHSAADTVNGYLKRLPQDRAALEA